MKTYFIKDIFESRRGIGIELMSDDISEENIIFYVSAATLKKMGLSKGMDIDEIVYSEIEDAHKLRVAVYKAADLLAAGDYSVARLQKKLTEKGIDKETAEKAAQYMEDRGYIREAEQAADLARYLAETKMRGKKRIYAELIQKGYGKFAVKHAIESISDEEFNDILTQHIKTKYKTSAADRKETEKRVAALMRQGFSAGDIVKALKEIDADNAEI